MTSRQFFQYLSYLQYPFMAVALYYALQCVLVGSQGRSAILDALNYTLLFAGIGIGLSSLQDPTKTQNKLSRRIWESPTKGKWMLVLFAIEAFVPIILGLYGAFRATDTALNQLSLGMVALGLGMIGLLKTAIEMRENFRTDRQAAQAEVAPS